MLKVIIGYKDSSVSINEVSVYFDMCYKPEWLNSDFAKEVILGVDKSKHVKDSYIESPVLGAIPPEKLSSGCKALILCKFVPDGVICGDRMGDNCYPYLLKLCETQDVTITLAHIPFLQQVLRTGNTEIPFRAYIENYNRDVYTWRELATAINEYAREQREKLRNLRGKGSENNVKNKD